jgi:O-succinylbenzoate synthase
MRIRAVELRRLELELVTPLATARGTHRRRPVVLVHVETDDGRGDGECDALAERGYTDEDADGAEATLAADLIPLLMSYDGRDSEFGTVGEALARLDVVAGHPMAKAALEMALLDAELRVSGRSLAEAVGATRPAIPAGVTVGLGDVDSVVAAARAAVASGYRRVKLKIAPGRDTDPLTAVRRELPAVALVADANGSYDISDAEHRAALRAIDVLGLAALEQPLAATDLSGSARLVAELATPIILDESIGSTEALEAALAARACSGVSVKPARLGGILAAVRVHDRCRAAGVHLSIGGMLEGGLARAATIALGALDGFDLPGDLGGSDRYFRPDVTAAHELVDGELPVPRGPGLGVELDREVVRSVTVRSRVFRPS